jgi:cation diffusion facilitator family transporter
MHTQTLAQWQHSHDFAILHKKGARRTQQVLVLTALTMVVEIVVGAMSGSMALLADGWHMGTHVAAFMITLFTYNYARKHHGNALFAFGAGKVGVLGGFASAIALAVVALVMAVESLQRIFEPRPIHFEEAIGVAILGLIVNVVCAFLLESHHDHGAHDHDAHHHDHNLKAAYLHVLADAFTSVLAIIALVSAKMFGWHQLDPLMGIVGAVVITNWAYGLLKETAPILLDNKPEEDDKLFIMETIENDADNRVADLHLWKVGPDAYAVIVSLVTHFPRPIENYKALLRDFPKLSHITVEVNHCSGQPCVAVETQV